MSRYLLGSASCLLTQILLLLKACQASSLHHITTTCWKRQSCSFLRRSVGPWWLFVWLISCVYFRNNLQKHKKWWNVTATATEVSIHNHLQPDLPNAFLWLDPTPQFFSSLALFCFSRGVYSHSFPCNSFLAYYSPQSTPEVSHNSLLMSLFSCGIRGGGVHWEQAIRIDNGTLFHSL